jgi:hypothetical protein
MHCVILNNSCRFFRLEQRVLFFLHPRPISLTVCVVIKRSNTAHTTHMHSPSASLLSPVLLNAIVLALRVCVLLLHDFIPTSCAHSLHQSDIHIACAAPCFPTAASNVCSQKHEIVNWNRGRRIAAKQLSIWLAL